MQHSLNRITPGVVQIFSSPEILTPTSATLLFVVACLAGYRYRHVWKAEGPRWQLWLYGLVAAGALLVLGFVPMSQTG